MPNQMACRQQMGAAACQQGAACWQRGPSLTGADVGGCAGGGGSRAGQAEAEVFWQEKLAGAGRQRMRGEAYAPGGADHMKW